MSDEMILAYCGLVCNDCGAFKKQKCEGCHSERPLNKGCKVKPCAVDKGIITCADCDEFEDLAKCKKLNNFISKIFKLIFKTDRLGNLQRIRQNGLEQFKAAHSP